ncbi:ABC transporter ATP-binding protein [Allgaiera indica]|uniref:ABC transporter ATP-binding protein n=1 Tax=Allgaiera indica TaxID=765699 RepID=A0AAN4UNI3_9RHOB|nr:ABC transporter ATP-binding protein [Allgaiera indica]GHD98573.1 ABC transporter ATP-binding protein [Allgaiera indica]SDW10658.1 ABC-type bacteriocin/lantibiotic exporter, contains an N-terminal double-glycine peptidase domain [Allgaiera indica]
MIDFALWKKAWELLDRRERRNAWIVLIVVVVSAFSSALMVGSVMPFLSVLSDPGRIHQNAVFAWAYRTGGFTSDYAFLIGLGVGSLAIILLSNLLQIFRTLVVARYTTMRMHTFSHRLLTAYLRQRYEFFLNANSGNLSTQVLSEVQVVVGQFLTPAADVITSLLTISVIVALLIWVNPVVALAAFAILGGLYGTTYMLSHRIVKREGEVRAETNKARFRIVSEAFGGAKDIKLLGREAAYVRRFDTPSLRMARSLRISTLSSQLPQYAMQIVAFGGMILLCLLLVDPEGLASGRALGGILPLLGVFAFAGQKMMPELQKLYGGLTRLKFARAAIESIHEDLIEKGMSGPLAATPDHALPLKHALVLDQVAYRYPAAEAQGLEGVSLSIQAGEKIGIVGSSGAGKTTLADLLLGLLQPTAGRMTVDGVEITEDNVRAWQQSVGYVPQDIFLTDSTIAENIALGSLPEEIDHARVRRAAEIARLDRFIREELPQGYDTTVGERGVRLSGGQRQRIGIARAMYHDADLIVFDEATSALDNVTEHEVMEAIDNLPGDKTVLIIAHRLTTLQNCDRILMLDHGRVAGFDCWDALIEGNAGFRKIARVG